MRLILLFNTGCREPLGQWNVLLSQDEINLIIASIPKLSARNDDIAGSRNNVQLDSNPLSIALSYLYCRIMDEMNVYFRTVTILGEFSNDRVTSPSSYPNGRPFFDQIIDEEREVWEGWRGIQKVTFQEYLSAKRRVIDSLRGV